MEKIGESLPQKYQSYTIIYCGNLPLDLSFSAFDDWNNWWNKSQMFLGKTRRNTTQIITIKLGRTAVNAHLYSDSIDIWLLFYVVNKLIKKYDWVHSFFNVPCSLFWLQRKCFSKPNEIRKILTTIPCLASRTRRR